MRKEKGADQDIGLEYLTQNWHFLTFPEPFLAARGHSLRNPDAFRSSVPAYNPMGASRIVSAKKHFCKVSKCSALLYAFQTNVLVRPPSLFEIAFVDTKLVFSACRDPGVVTC